MVRKQKKKKEKEKKKKKQKELLAWWKTEQRQFYL